MKKISLYIFMFLAIPALGQDNFVREKGTMMQVRNTIDTLIQICRDADESDPKGQYNNAAEYFVFRGKDRKRKFKDVCNYSNPKERKQVDDVCAWITANIVPLKSYEFGKFITNEEKEGIWYVQEVKVTIDGVDRQAWFAFLKFGKRFALVDIE